MEGLEKIIHRPIKVEVQQKGKLINVYNFADFMPGKKKDKITQIPDGYGCSGGYFNQPKPPSYNATEYEMTFELVDTQINNGIGNTTTQTVTVARMLNFGLHSYLLRKYVNAKWPHPYRVVHDSFRKINYATDLFAKTCSINKTSVGYGLKWPESNDTSLDILDPNFLSTSNGYNYLGETTIRGQPTLVFEKVVNGLQGSYKSLIITQFFQKQSVSLSDSAAFNAGPTRVLVRAFADTARTTLTRQIGINVHKYSTPIQQKVSLFDVSGCFEKPEDYTWFEMTFAARDGVMTPYKNDRKIVKNVFYDLMNFLPPTRLPTVLVDISPNAIIVTAKALERPSVEFSYDRYPDKQMQNSRFLGKRSLTPSMELCGQLCYNMPDCRGFSYCSSSLECDQIIVIPYKVNNFESYLDSAAGCDSYSKINVTTAVDPGDYSLPYLMSYLEYKIEIGDITLELPMIPTQNSDNTDGQRPEIFIFTAVEIKPNIEPGFNDEIINNKIGSKVKPTQDLAIDIVGTIANNYLVVGRSAALDFELVKDKPSTKYVGASLSDCISSCDDTPFCQSLSFCTETGQCIVSSFYGSEKDFRTVSTSNNKCTILSKKYLAMYNFQNNYYLAEEQTLVQADQEEDCARECNNYQDFPCLSFDFCQRQDQKPTCSLYKLHSQVNRTNTRLKYDDDCIHYSKKYTYDFKPFVGKKLKSEELLTIRALTTDSCALKCEQENCNTFEYCQNTIFGSFKMNDICRIASNSLNAQSDLIKNQNCTVYSRNEQKSDTLDGVSKGHNTALGIFLSLFLLIIGVSIAAAAIWVYLNKVLVR